MIYETFVYKYTQTNATCRVKARDILSQTNQNYFSLLIFLLLQQKQQR